MPTATAASAGTRRRPTALSSTGSQRSCASRLQRIRAESLRQSRRAQVPQRELGLTNAEDTRLILRRANPKATLEQVAELTDLVKSRES
jgi:hypothetical protein